MKLAALICRGSVATARGIRKVTIMGSSGINKYALIRYSLFLSSLTHTDPCTLLPIDQFRSKRYLTQKLTPVEEPVVLSPKLQNGLSKAQIGGKAVVKVSGGMLCYMLCFKLFSKIPIRKKSKKPKNPAVLTGAIAAANALSNEVSDAVADTSYGKRYGLLCYIMRLGRGAARHHHHYHLLFAYVVCE